MPEPYTRLVPHILPDGEVTLYNSITGATIKGSIQSVLEKQPAVFLVMVGDEMVEATHFRAE